MVRNGVLRADRAHLFCGDDFLGSYNWMSQQMRMRISEPPHGVQYPVWLWHTWEGNRKRPDMRKSAYAAPNTPIVLLTVEIPDEMVLLSDIDRWNIVMNGHYVAVGADDDSSHSLKEIYESWNRIFDVSCVNPYYSFSLFIQATVWEIRKEWIKKRNSLRRDNPYSDQWSRPAPAPLFHF